MSFLDTIETEIKVKPPAIILAGPPGSGKTSLAAQFPNPLFIIDKHEDGINDLKQAGQVPAEIPVAPPFDTWEELLAGLDELLDTAHGYKWLVFDALKGFERLCHVYTAQEEYDGDMGEAGFMSFKRGYDTAITYWMVFLDKLEQLRAKGVGIILLSHTIIKTFQDPKHSSYDKYICDVHPKTFTETSKWASMIGIMEFVLQVSEDKKDKKVRAAGGHFRQLSIHHSALFDGKNRYNIVAPIPQGTCAADGYTAFMKTIKEAKAPAA